jgi:hypothetical protein
VIGCRASGPRGRPKLPLAAAQIESWRERHQLDVINCASHINAWNAFEFRRPHDLRFDMQLENLHARES